MLHMVITNRTTQVASICHITHSQYMTRVLQKAMLIVFTKIGEIEMNWLSCVFVSDEPPLL